LGQHILEGPANEEIVERHDLSTGTSLDIADDIENFAAIGHARGTAKSLLHISVSPDVTLSLEQERTMLETIRRVYVMPRDHPLLVVQHRKPGQHERADHYHVVALRPKADGKLISSRASYAKNERISRECEIDFGHKIEVGRFSRAVREALDVERPDIAPLVDPKQRATKKHPTTQTVADKQQARDTQLDLDSFDRVVLDAYLAGIGTADKVVETLAARGILLAAGRKAVMVVYGATGSAYALNRVVNREAKRRDLRLSVTEGEIQKLFGSQPPLSQVKGEGLKRALRRSQSTLAKETLLEAQLAPDIGARPTKVKAETDAEKPPPGRARKRSQAALRTEIIDNYREAKRKRRRNVELAWQRAWTLSDRDVRKAMAIAAGVLTFYFGAPVLVAVAAAYAAAALLAVKHAVDVAQAREIAARSKIEQQRSLIEMRSALGVLNTKHKSLRTTYVAPWLSSATVIPEIDDSRIVRHRDIVQASYRDFVSKLISPAIGARESVDIPTLASGSATHIEPNSSTRLLINAEDNSIDEVAADEADAKYVAAANISLIVQQQLAMAIHAEQEGRRGDADKMATEIASRSSFDAVRFLRWFRRMQKSGGQIAASTSAAMAKMNSWPLPKATPELASALRALGANDSAAEVSAAVARVVEES